MWWTAKSTVWYYEASAAWVDKIWWKSSKVKTFVHRVVFCPIKKCCAQKPDTESDANIHNMRVNKSWKQDQSEVSLHKAQLSWCLPGGISACQWSGLITCWLHWNQTIKIRPLISWSWTSAVSMSKTHNSHQERIRKKKTWWTLHLFWRNDKRCVFKRSAILDKNKWVAVWRPEVYCVKDFLLILLQDWTSLLRFPRIHFKRWKRPFTFLSNNNNCQLSYNWVVESCLVVF